MDAGDEKPEELPASQAPAIPHVKHIAPLIAKSQPMSGYAELASANGSCQPRGATIPTLSPIRYSPSLPIDSGELPTSTSPKRGAAGNGEAMVAANDKENVPSLQWAESEPRLAVSCNPMNTLAAAAARVKMAALPPPPKDELNVAGNSDIAAGTESKDRPETGSSGKTRTKFRPSGTKNGRNLCIIRWLKHVNKEGTKDEFRMYYDSLTKTQHEAYDEEAKDLVQKNAWVKATIENGVLH